MPLITVTIDHSATVDISSIASHYLGSSFVPYPSYRSRTEVVERGTSRFHTVAQVQWRTSSARAPMPTNYACACMLIRGSGQSCTPTKPAAAVVAQRLGQGGRCA